MVSLNHFPFRDHLLTNSDYCGTHRFVEPGDKIEEFDPVVEVT